MDSWDCCFNTYSKTFQQSCESKIYLFGRSNCLMFFKLPTLLQTKEQCKHKSVCVRGMFIMTYYDIDITCYVFWTYLCVIIRKYRLYTLYIQIVMSTQTQLPYAGAQQYYRFTSIYERSSVKANRCLLVFELMLTKKRARAFWCQTQIVALLLAFMFEKIARSDLLHGNCRKPWENGGFHGILWDLPSGN